MEPTHDNDALSRLAPTLARLDRSDPFVVPEGFQDRFPLRVQQAIAARQPTAHPLLTWRRVAIALPVCALLALMIWWSMPATSPANPPATASIPTESELLDSDLHDLLADAGPYRIFGDVTIDLDEAEVMAWLEREGTDYNDLIEEP